MKQGYELYQEDKGITVAITSKTLWWTTNEWISTKHKADGSIAIVLSKNKQNRYYFKSENEAIDMAIHILTTIAIKKIGK